VVYRVEEKYLWRVEKMCRKKIVERVATSMVALALCMSLVVISGCGVSSDTPADSSEKKVQSDTPHQTESVDEALTQEKIAVLVTGYRHYEIGHIQARHLVERGMTVNQTDQDLDRAPLNLKELKKYHVVVVMGIGKAHADNSLTEINRKNCEVLTRYIEQGGGVVYIPSWIQNISAMAPQEQFCNALGVTLLFSDLLFDREMVHATPYDIPFAYTTAIRRHPATAGVEGMWYPVAKKNGDQLHCTPFRADAEWTELIAGEATAFTRKIPLKVHKGFESFPVGEFNSSPTIAAVRSYHKGRVAIWAIAPEYVVGSFATTSLSGVVYDKGLEGKRSDGKRFFENLLRYCAGSSVAESTFGGAETDEALLVDKARVTQWTKPYNWQKDRGAPPAKRAFSGVLGARTTRSSGDHSVAQWVAAARKEGLHYIVFLEKFSELSREEFDSLKQECKALSGDDFKAIPGFTIDDEIGNHYFYCGNIAYPPAKLLDKTGSVFIPYDARHKVSPGRLSMTTLSYAHGISSFKLTAGNYLFNADASPCANWFSNWDTIAVFTRENGVTKEDATEVYLKNADAGQWPFPVALELMDSVEFLNRDSIKTVLKLDSIDAVERFWSSWHSYPSNPTNIYVSGGPAIDLWAMSGHRDYEGNNRGDFVWQNLRWNIYGKVSSDVGLKEVTVMDGEELLRKFRPDGKKEFSFTIELNHDKQHNLVLIATDINGKQAVSAEQLDRNHRYQEVNCTDRNNQLVGAKVINSSDIPIDFAYSDTATYNKRTAKTWISPAKVLSDGHKAFDGGAASDSPSFYDTIYLRTDGGKIKAPDAVESERLVASGDLLMGQATHRWSFADNIPVATVWETLWKTEPAETFIIRRRRTAFQIDPDRPLTVSQWELEIELLKDMPHHTGFKIGYMAPNGATGWCAQTSDGKRQGGSWSEKSASQKSVLNFDGSGYLALTGAHSGAAALISQADGLCADMDPRNKGAIALSITPESSPHRKGEKRRVTLLFLGVSKKWSPELNEGEAVDRFYKTFALAPGSKPGYSLQLQEGSVGEYGYPLKLELSREGGVVAEFRGEFSSSLALSVAGANSNWSAFLYDYELCKSRPVALFESAIWATIASHGERKIFIGHPIVCDNPEMIIQVAQKSYDIWGVEVHNPTASEVKIALKTAKNFEPFEGLSLPQESVVLKAGQSISLELQ
jgi:hypothetical protein